MIKFYIVISLLILALLILLNYSITITETFNNNTKYDFEKYCIQENNKNQNQLISRIRKVENDTLYKINKLPKHKDKITILIEDYKYFIDNELPKLNKKVSLVITDHPFRSLDASVYNYKNFLNNKMIKNVYAEDWIDKEHPKLVILPIGVESKASVLNSKEKEKDMIIISKRQKKLKDKPLKIMCNSHFSKYTNPKSGSYNQRQEVVDKLKNNKLKNFWKNKTNRLKTWKLHDNYSFELCPEGNGLDTHRFYEALLLNTIPIVKRNSLESMYVKFPCVIVDNWNEITEKNCIKWKKDLVDRVENEKYKLYCEYWKK